MIDLRTYDHYLFAAVALFGTFAASGGLLWLAHRSRLAGRVAAWRGVSPPFVNVVGVLFALTLAFLANDTWNAHDRALNATFQEAGNLSNILALTDGLPDAARDRVRQAVGGYARLVMDEEWALLGERRSSAAAARAQSELLSLLAGREVSGAIAPGAHAAVLAQAVEVHANRELRLALSRTHVNPLKWLGMAFLGFLTMVAVAMVYRDELKAEITAVLLFATAAAPTAAIVLVQGNPFQAPTAVTSAPFLPLAQLR